MCCSIFRKDRDSYFRRVNRFEIETLRLISWTWIAILYGVGCKFRQQQVFFLFSFGEKFFCRRKMNDRTSSFFMQLKFWLLIKNRMTYCDWLIITDKRERCVSKLDQRPHIMNVVIFSILYKFKWMNKYKNSCHKPALFSRIPMSLIFFFWFNLSEDLVKVFAYVTSILKCFVQFHYILKFLKITVNTKNWEFIQFHAEFQLRGIITC